MRTISLPTLKGIGSTPERAIDEEVIFVGHSVGGSVLLSYLAVARTSAGRGVPPPIVAGNAGFARRLHGREESSGVSLSSPGAVLGQGPVLQQTWVCVSTVVMGVNESCEMRFGLGGLAVEQDTA